MKKSPLRKLSGKRRKQVNEYMKVRRKYLEDHMICEVCTEREATQIHHKKGRQGDRITDETAFLAICEFCHSWVHTHPEASMKAGWLLHRTDNL